MFTAIRNCCRTIFDCFFGRVQLFFKDVIPYKKAQYVDFGNTHVSKGGDVPNLAMGQRNFFSGGPSEITPFCPLAPPLIRPYVH